MRLSLSGVPLFLFSVACHQRFQPAEESFKAPSEVWVVPNLDDDNQDGVTDWESKGVKNDDDRARALLWADEGTMTISVTGDARVYRAGELVLYDDVTQADMPVNGDVLLEFEVPDFLSEATVDVSWVGVNGEQEQARIAVHGARLVLNHHEQVAEQVYAMDGGRNVNGDFIDGFTTVLGDDFSGFDLGEYGYDVWIQDEIELGTATAPGQRLNVVIDSVRAQGGRYLDNLPENELSGPDVYIHTWGDGRASSQDSFGNMEVLPPFSANGMSYPLGRIYYGMWEGGGPQQELIDELEAQAVQDPFQLDTTFLCVGHVDEFMTTIPDPTAPKGFRIFVADTALGRTFLEALDPELELSRYKNAHGYGTVGAILDDEALWAYNEDVQRDYIDANMETLAIEAGVTEADLVHIPAVFEQNSYCGGYGLSMIPGTVNMEVARLSEDGPIHLFMPDPFLREDDDDQGSDPLIAYVNDLLPANVEPHWLNDWRAYHVAWGEVHCGSNTMRTPSDENWTQRVTEEN